MKFGGVGAGGGSRTYLLRFTACLLNEARLRHHHHEPRARESLHRRVPFRAPSPHAAGHCWRHSPAVGCAPGAPAGTGMHVPGAVSEHR